MSAAEKVNGERPMGKVEHYEWDPSSGDDCPYPCVIVADRYGGSYSGGPWVAYPLFAEPEGPSGQDHEATAFWDAYATAPAHPIGVGESPDEALADLRAKARGERDWRAGKRWWLDCEGDPEPYEPLPAAGPADGQTANEQGAGVRPLPLGGG